MFRLAILFFLASAASCLVLDGGEDIYKAVESVDKAQGVFVHLFVETNSIECYRAHVAFQQLEENLSCGSFVFYRADALRTDTALFGRPTTRKSVFVYIPPNTLNSPSEWKKYEYEPPLEANKLHQWAESIIS